MKIAVIGGGPAGLFFAYLMKRADAAHDVVVLERDPEGATYGWGVVFSDVALAFVRDVAPELYAAITRQQEVFSEMAIVHRGRHVRLANNVFHRMSRIDLLRALQDHCRKVGVRIKFKYRCSDVTEFWSRDLIVAADGANSTIRTRHADRFQPTLDVRPNLLAWYGTTRLFDPLSLIFRTNADGLLIAHTYRYSRTHSTFLVECDPATFKRSGLDRMTEAESIAYCERVFADDLLGEPLLSNPRRGSITRSSATPTGTTTTWCCSATRCGPAILRWGRAPGSRCRIRSRCSMPGRRADRMFRRCSSTS